MKLSNCIIWNEKVTKVAIPVWHLHVFCPFWNIESKNVKWITKAGNNCVNLESPVGERREGLRNGPGEIWILFFFQTVCHSHTKPSSLDSERIRAAKCHLWWITPLTPGIFTHTAGLAVDGVFQCHLRSVVVWYEKRLCEGRAGHLSTLTFHAKTFSSTWRLNSTLSS